VRASHTTGLDAVRSIRIFEPSREKCASRSPSCRPAASRTGRAAALEDVGPAVVVGDTRASAGIEPRELDLAPEVGAVGG